MSGFELLPEPPAPPVAAAWAEVVECLEAGRLFEASQALSARPPWKASSSIAMVRSARSSATSSGKDGTVRSLSTSF